METKFDDNYDYLFTMCVVGDQSVGKSSLVQRYTENDFKCLDDIRPTVGIDFKLKYLSKYGHKILLQLWDSSGQKKYRNVINHFIARMMGVILVLDVTSTDSLSQLGHWIEVIRRHTFPETQVILLGNKCDQSSVRIVAKEEMQRYTEELNIIYMECSCKENSQISEVFDVMINLIISKMKEVIHVM